MVKRAGKRKHRNGNQRHPPGATSKPPTIVEDNLPAQVSRAIEKQALGDGWLSETPTFQETREALMKKLAIMALGSKNENTVRQIVDTLVKAELGEKKLRLLADKQRKPPTFDASAVREIKVHETIATLIARRDVRQALDHTDASRLAQPYQYGGVVDDGPIQEGSTPQLD